MTGRGYGTINRVTKNLYISDDILRLSKSQQGGSKAKSINEWSLAKTKASKLMHDELTLTNALYLLAGLYWGEGDKREVSLINSDPELIKCFVDCLSYIGVKKYKLKISLRLYADLDKQECLKFWSSLLQIDEASIKISEILSGNKSGKLKYGMCRVRVAKSGQYFKLIMSIINEVKIKQLLP
jgi:hypothetical protein